MKWPVPVHVRMLLGMNPQPRPDLAMSRLWQVATQAQTAGRQQKAQIARLFAKKWVAQADVRSVQSTEEWQNPMLKDADRLYWIIAFCCVAAATVWIVGRWVQQGHSWRGVLLLTHGYWLWTVSLCAIQFGREMA